MVQRVALTHRSVYHYDEPVSLGPHFVRLRPSPHCRTPIVAYSLRITPTAHSLHWQQDPFGNFLARVAVRNKTREFSATVDLLVDMAPINPFDFYLEPRAASWPFTYGSSLAQDLTPYLESSAAEKSSLLDAFVDNITAAPHANTIDFVCEINRILSHDIAYRRRMEAGVQTSDETLASRSGSCRDTGWLLVQILRRVGLAARFVSGYLIQLAPETPSEHSAGDVADLHAWAEVFLPGAGWIGLDPTSGLLAGEGHIPLAATPSPISAAPIEGTHTGANVEFDFSTHVERMREAPRVANPYGEKQWQQILAAGAVVDQRLEAADVRLSMGGEPTFVALDDSEAPEWNLAALGPTKRTFADKLARGLHRRFARGGLLHYGHGKWYPGESEARWAFSVYWRNDGHPLWRDTKLIADESTDRPATISDARRVVQALCDCLGLPNGSAIAAHEDAAHYALIEQKLPLGIGPQSNTLADPAERARLIRTFDHGLDTPVGYVLPLLHSADGRRFITERWKLRRERLFLVPGDSPIGLRLPLSGLPQVDFIDYPSVLPADPFADQRPLPLVGPVPSCQTLEATCSPASVKDAELVRTALVVQPRHGHVCVFLPPLEDGEQYASLVRAIEGAAAATSQPVRLEGYAPPFDARLKFIRVTPDPGVIEVNVHPGLSWDETVAITTGVYEEAAQIGLVAEKFRRDGSRAPTGGGNHIVVGGVTPADSPFLRRPDLLASIINYWQNHPSLSYMFAGQFVGPTSQAPRIDEARHESLYEIEIAINQIPDHGGAIAPWLVDRLFRNLLVDVTGNLHRAEICIDKLYSPQGPNGRMGLVEFRAFEMVPRAQMSVAQQLLVRALIAWLWEQPYRRSLVRWGTALHDRFMLPHFLWADFESIVADLRAAGFPLNALWYVPHLEFRFPVVGTIELGGITLELRRAHEPWHVLGEQIEQTGASRAVDASLERLQVLVRGALSDRYTITCNGFSLPLTKTGTAGEMLAGVRFRARPAIQGFHPTIPPHVPLTFDVCDTWNDRSIGGCRYHAVNPNGMEYQSMPVNAREAEARLSCLFEPQGHSPGGAAFKRPQINADFPLTLDLRRADSCYALNG